MCQYNCMSRWQTHVSLSTKHILCNIQYIHIQYTIYNIYIIYIYVYTPVLTPIHDKCPWACEYMCPSVFHNFVRKKNESTGSHVIKNRAHLTCQVQVHLTWPVFIPELEMVKTIPKWWTNGIGWIPYQPLEATLHGKRTTSELVVLGPSGSLTAKKMGKMVVELMV